MWWIKNSQVEWTDQAPTHEYDEVTGRNFNLKNKTTGEMEDVFIPFNAPGDINDKITSVPNKMLVGTPAEVFNFAAIKESARRGKIASAYILSDGRCALMRPHNHDEVARAILPRSMVPESHDYDRSFGIAANADLMPLYANAIRVQMMPDGIGCTIDMAVPPNQAQLNSIREYYELTGGDVFVAEVKYNGQMIAWVRSLPDFQRFLATFNKVKDSEKPMPTQIREFLQRQDMDDAWYGKEQRVANGERERIVFA